MIKAHLGCGDNLFDGWVNVDLNGPAQVKADLSKGVPFGNEQLDYIYSEHFIEHVSKDEGIKFLENCFKALKYGGKIRIATPDLKVFCEEYLRGKIDRWITHWVPNSPCDMINESMRKWGHQYIYDELELSNAIKKAGFTNIHRCAYHESDDDNLKNLETRPNWEDLYFEAIKL